MAGRRPARAVLRHRARERVHGQAEGVVAGHLAEVARADAEQVHRLVHAGVDLVGGVHDEARPPPPRPSSRTLPGVIARRAAASAMKFAMDPPEARMPCALAREAHELAQPADHAVLDVDRGVVAAPAVRVHGRGQVVGDGAQGIGGGVDEAEEPRVRVAHRPRHARARARRPGSRRRAGPSSGSGMSKVGGVGADLAEHGAVGRAARGARRRSPRPGARGAAPLRGRDRNRSRRSSAALRERAL